MSPSDKGMLALLIATFLAAGILWLWRRRKHRVSILWKSGRITRHRTTGVVVSTNRLTGSIIAVQSDWLWPRIVDCDVEHIAAVMKGRVR